MGLLWTINPKWTLKSQYNRWHKGHSHTNDGVHYEYEGKSKDIKECNVDFSRRRVNRPNDLLAGLKANTSMNLA